MITLLVEKTYTGKFINQLHLNIDEKHPEKQKIYDVLRETLNLMYGCTGGFYNHRHLLVLRSGSGFSLGYRIDHPPAKQNIQELEDSIRKALELCLSEIAKLQCYKDVEKIVKGLQKKNYVIRYDFPGNQ